MKIHNFSQGSPEWFEARGLKMTASHAQAIGTGKKGLETYILDKVADFLSEGQKEGYTSAEMQRGNELEDEARSLYELETGNKVEEVGFIEVDEFIGCSPDGLIGQDGGVEIKCMNDRKHLEVVLFGQDRIESKYIWQIQMNMYCTNRVWWDYVAYNPNFKKCFKIVRIERDDDQIEKLIEGLEKGKELIKMYQEKYNETESYIL